MRPTPHRSKAVLFCPACDHQSTVDGDWVRVARTDGRDRTVYRCPDCDAVVTVRPSFESPAAEA